MSTVKDYQTVIHSMDMLAMKMEVITQELFEANIEFISKLAESDLKEELNGNLSTYGARFQGLLADMEAETKLLKREKINYQFKRKLMTERMPLV
ncbi:hypothetical protein JMN32_05265 [Fulvivirga sp. 29W222]|uniref:Uncharacterized protein n=1 Tax=Fulvivirga marina TaxID=2494733 RepID=A0A937FW60_9BACT|nr:hypothetical protein [Fulvivirga marina]MBL6445707.1 hypothetical protein [Fulvivirga marina]